ncbi:hypothetical protein GWI33_017600 [Rhynchophorus ferrugineus]|uniref:Uncharacterized protein n=1 Tax=Rhynchophorus ferrugineus TaxID=354439 RepID=A0A834HVM8_RHYFE|nr:hypothetical protein GWI33_017600 [Rhynchophorus ferrugineus]
MPLSIGDSATIPADKRGSAREPSIPPAFGPATAFFLRRSAVNTNSKDGDKSGWRREIYVPWRGPRLRLYLRPEGRIKGERGRYLFLLYD